MILPAALLVSTPAMALAGENAWVACIDRTTTNYNWGMCGGTYVRTADVALNAEWNG